MDTHARSRARALADPRARRPGQHGPLAQVDQRAGKRCVHCPTSSSTWRRYGCRAHWGVLQPPGCQYALGESSTCARKTHASLSLKQIHMFSYLCFLNNINRKHVSLSLTIRILSRPWGGDSAIRLGTNPVTVIYPYISVCIFMSWSSAQVARSIRMVPRSPMRLMALTA